MGGKPAALSDTDALLALEAASLGLWAWDGTDQMVASERCWSLWNASPAGPGAWTACMPPDDAARVTGGLRHALWNAGGVDEEYRIRQPDGAVRWLSMLGRRVRDRAGVRIVGIVEDVSARKDAERAQAALGAIVASCDDAIIGKLLDGTITSWNAAATRIFGYSPDEIVGRNIALLIPEDRRHEEPQIIAAVRAGRLVSHYESKRRRKDGSLVDVSLTVSPIHDERGRVVGASKIARDITATRRAREAEQDAGRRKDLLLAVLAHELRNPLAPIRCATRILELRALDRPEARQAREILDRQVDRLVHLVDEFLDVDSMTLRSANEGAVNAAGEILGVPHMLQPEDAHGPEGSTTDAAETSRQEPPADRYRFLVVDDNVDSADSQTILLRMLGHEVWTSYDGESALAAAQAHQPQVVLLDLGMPGMNGFEVARRLRLLPGLSRAVLVAQTGWGQAEFRERSVQAGFDAHLTKPVDLSALLEVLNAQRPRLTGM